MKITPDAKAICITHTALLALLLDLSVDSFSSHSPTNIAARHRYTLWHSTLYKHRIALSGMVYKLLLSTILGNTCNTVY